MLDHKIGDTYISNVVANSLARLSTKLYPKVVRASGLGRKQSIRLEALREVDGEQHLLTWDVHRGGRRYLHIRISYTELPRDVEIPPVQQRKLEKETPQIDAIFQALRELGIEEEWNCHVDWTFPQDQFAPVVKLPMSQKVTEYDKAFDIIGVRIATEVYDGTELTAIFELISRQRLHVHLDFKCAAFPEEAIARAVGFGQEYLSQFEAKGG